MRSVDAVCIMTSSRRKSKLLAVACLLLASGACGLVYQIVWSRDFRLLFGATTPAVAAVAATFLAGLGLGNRFLGPVADRSSRPLLLYGVLEIGIAALAAVSPAVMEAVTAVYLSVASQTDTTGVATTVLRAGLACLVVIAPTFLMGGTLPAAAKAVIRSDDPQRGDVGLLYGVNTLGAVAGVALSTFLLLEHLGSRGTLWMTCLINATIGTVACGIGSSSQAVDMPPCRPDAEGVPPSKYEGEPRHDQGLPLASVAVCCLAGVVGFAFLLMELVWYRMLGPILGGTTFTYGLILAVALAGMGCGGVAYRWLFAARRPTLGDFAATCALEAIALILPFACGDRIALLAERISAWRSVGFAGQVAAWTLVTTLVVFPAAFAAGVQFPVLLGLAGRGGHRLGSQIGRVYAWNTAGALAGAASGGFGLLPLLSAPGAWSATAHLLAATAAITAGVEIVRQRVRRPVPVAAIAVAAVAAALAALPGPTAVWRHSGIGVGRAAVPFSAGPNAVQDWMHARRRYVVLEREGLESSIAIGADHGLSLCINGKVDGNAIGDAATQIMLGLLGALLHEEPHHSLVVGLGTGETAGWLAVIPGMAAVDVVEMEPAVLEMARRCAPVNHDILERPNVRVITNDARETLLKSRQTYDLIVSEPSNPYRAGIASLYTREFYTAVRHRLAARGVFVQWLQTYAVDAALVDVVFATLKTVFAHVEVWQGHTGDMLLVCGDGGWRPDVATLRSRLADEPFRTGCRVAWQAEQVEAVLAHFVAGDGEVARRARAATAPNTDDRNRLEYWFAKCLDDRRRFSAVKLRVDARLGGAGRPLLGGGDIDWALVEDFHLAYHAREGGFPRFPWLQPDQTLRAEAVVAHANGNYRATLDTWRRQRAAPLPGTQALAVAHAAAELGDPELTTALAVVRRSDPLTASLLRGVGLAGDRGHEEAANTLADALAALRDDPWAASDVGGAALRAAVDLAETDPTLAPQLYAAVAAPFAVGFLEESRRLAAWRIAASGPVADVRAALAAMEPWPPWREPILKSRVKAYAGLTGPLPARSIADLRRFQRDAPKPDSPSPSP